MAISTGDIIKDKDPLYNKDTNRFEKPKEKKEVPTSCYNMEIKKQCYKCGDQNIGSIKTEFDHDNKIITKTYQCINGHIFYGKMPMGKSKIKQVSGVQGRSNFHEAGSNRVYKKRSFSNQSGRDGTENDRTKHQRDREVKQSTNLKSRGFK